MPVEIVDEFDTWRRIRDWQGTECWVHQSMVRGQRGILVTGKRPALRWRPEAGAPGGALVDAGVVGGREARMGVEWGRRVAARWDSGGRRDLNTKQYRETR